jgi:hypothetical protein
MEVVARVYEEYSTLVRAAIKGKRCRKSGGTRTKYRNIEIGNLHKPVPEVTDEAAAHSTMPLKQGRCMDQKSVKSVDDTY